MSGNGIFTTSGLHAGKFSCVFSISCPVRPCFSEKENVSFV